MKRLLSWVLLLMVVVQVRAAEKREIKLWPQGMPEPIVPTDPAEAVVKGPDGISRRSNVSQPRLFVHEPPAGVKKSGAGVIVVPGGGFGRLADEHEGSDACEWLAKNGIVAFQLAYRTPTNKQTEPHAGPVQDVQKALIEVRKLAAEFGVDAKKIGVLGFSAGGQVALIAATNEPRFLGANGIVKPDFLLLIYPYQIYDKATKALRADIKLEAGLPPTFIAQAGDDTASLPQGSTLLCLDLINRKTPAEIHIYEKGGHGFGMRPREGATGPTDWPVRFGLAAVAWLCGGSKTMSVLVTKGFAFARLRLKYRTMKSALLALGVLLGTSSAFAANWPQFRGPEFNGSSTEKNLPTQWSKTEKVAWSVDMPGTGAATPIVWDDHVFVSSTDKRTRSTVAMAIDRKTGKVLWQHTVGAGDSRDERSNYAAPSPATDGKLVVFFYGNGDLVAFDFSGKKLWQRNLQKDNGDFAFQWTFSTSPLLFEGKLYMQVLQRDVPVNGRGAKPSGIESYLLAIDPQTGKDIWKHIRPSDAAAESLEAFTTPVPFANNGRKELLIAGGDCLTGHDPVTGKELWRSGSWNPTKIGHWRLVPSPVAGDGVILGCAPKKSPVYAVKAGASGNVPWLWTSEAREVSSDVPTPLFYEGDFFVLSDVTSSISRVEPKTGKVKWTVATPGRSKHEGSPTGADGKIYIINFLGDVTVVNAADGKILSTIPMGEAGDNNTRSVVVASQGQLFIRTNTKLYCIDGATKKVALNTSGE